MSIIYPDIEELYEECERLQDEHDRLESAIADASDALSEDTTDGEMQDLIDAREDLEDWNADYGERWMSLNVLFEEISRDIELIPENEFIDYVQDLLSDIGDLPRNIPWYIEIDWEATADNIRQDYSQLDFEGETYLYRG